MRNSNEKRFTRTVLAASLAAIWLGGSVSAFAADDEVSRLIRPESEIEVGVGNVSDKSYKFGDYTGLNNSGAYGIVNLSVMRRGEDDARFLEIVARNLGLDARSLTVEGGDQGNYGLRFGYSELPKYYSDQFQTPYNGMGSSRLTAPAGWASSIDITPGGAINPPVGTSVVSTAMMTQLAANMKPFDVSSKRKDLMLGMTKVVNEGWNVEFSFNQNRKDGHKLKAAPLQVASGGSRGTVLIADPINYTDDQFSAVARYAGEKLQLQFGYNASRFRNSADPVVFDNLYYNGASTTGGNMLTGRLGSMPDNQAHQISASGAYMLSRDTRLSGSVSVGTMTQDEAYLPYMSTSPNALAALPVNSLGGKVDTKHLDFKINSKLSQSIKLTAGYRYDDRDNRTPVNKYIYQTGDNTLLSNYANSVTQGTTRYNMPLSKNKQVVFGDLDFHLAKATTLKLAYDYDQIKHTYEPTAGDKEHTFKAEVKHRFNTMGNAGLTLARSDRTAQTYDGGEALKPTYTAVYLASLCVRPNSFLYNGAVVACSGAVSATGSTSPWLDTPALRKYFLTDRKRDKARAFANFAPSNSVDLQFGASYVDDKYPDAENGYGLTHATGTSLNFDARLTVSDAVTGNFFMSKDRYGTDTNGHNGSTTNIDRQNNAAAFQAARSGITGISDDSWTAGAGFQVKGSGKVEWGANYTFTRSETATRFSKVGTAIAATVLPVPDTNVQLNRLDLFAKYKWNKDVTVNLNYTNERLESADWAYDGQTLTSSSFFVGTGMTAPRYNVQMLTATLAYRF